jgi:hypothetical protein
MAEESVGLFTGINPLQDTVTLLKDFGFFQVVLPLLLVFAVLYGILSVTKIFGDDDKAISINAIVAFSAAFFVISSTEVVAMMNLFLPQASFLLVISVFLLMLFSMFLGDPKEMLGKSKWWSKIALVIIFLVFLGVIDATVETIDIPVIHQLNDFFISDGGSGSGGSGGSGGGSGGAWYDNPGTVQLVNTLISILLVLAFPIIVIWLMIRASK